MSPSVYLKEREREREGEGEIPHTHAQYRHVEVGIVESPQNNGGGAEKLACCKTETIRVQSAGNSKCQPKKWHAFHFKVWNLCHFFYLAVCGHCMWIQVAGIFVKRKSAASWTLPLHSYDVCVLLECHEHYYFATKKNKKWTWPTY